MNKKGWRATRESSLLTLSRKSCWHILATESCTPLCWAWSSWLQSSPGGRPAGEPGPRWQRWPPWWLFPSAGAWGDGWWPCTWNREERTKFQLSHQNTLDYVLFLPRKTARKPLTPGEFYNYFLLKIRWNIFYHHLSPHLFFHLHPNHHNCYNYFLIPLS